MHELPGPDGMLGATVGVTGRVARARELGAAGGSETGASETAAVVEALQSVADAATDIGGSGGCVGWPSADQSIRLCTGTCRDGAFLQRSRANSRGAGSTHTREDY